jgi:hypothetical protein
VPARHGRHLRPDRRDVIEALTADALRWLRERERENMIDGP